MLFSCKIFPLKALLFKFVIQLIFHISEEAQQDQIDVMLKDACLTKGIFHDNVCSILAACLDPDQLPLLIYTNKNEKNLKLFLAECKLSEVLILSLHRSFLPVKNDIHIAYNLKESMNLILFVTLDHEQKTKKREFWMHKLSCS